MGQKELGIGVRVRMGWAPDSQIQPYLSHDPRMQEGVIVGGPIPPNETFVRPQKPKVDIINGGNSNRWRVELDCGTTVFPIEPLIFPVDDGGDSEAEEHDEIAEAESILRALQPHIRAMELDLGYDQIFSDRINAFLLDGE